MKVTLTEQGLWDVVENGIPRNPSKVSWFAQVLQAEDLCKWREFVVKDMKALQVLQSSLPDSVFRKTMETDSARSLWNLLKEGNQSKNDEVLLPEYEMLAYDSPHVTFDEGMWMIYSSVTNHMTPHEKYFTTLDRTHRGRIVLNNGNTIVSQGMGDVVIMTDNRNKKTIKDVLFVPGIDRNVLSRSQLVETGYGIGRSFGKTIRDERGAFMRLQVVDIPEYVRLSLSLDSMTYDEDMWMIHTSTSNHMTPYDKYFTTLDRTHRGRVKFLNGNTIMSQGMGDVVIMTDKGKKMTIKNVLYVPGIHINVLSVPQLSSIGYGILELDGSSKRCTIKDKTGRLFCEAIFEDRGIFLRCHASKGNVTSKSNH